MILLLLLFNVVYTLCPVGLWSGTFDWSSPNISIPISMCIYTIDNNSTTFTGGLSLFTAKGVGTITNRLNFSVSQSFVAQNNTCISACTFQFSGILSDIPFVNLGIFEGTVCSNDYNNCDIGKCPNSCGSVTLFGIVVDCSEAETISSEVAISLDIQLSSESIKNTTMIIPSLTLWNNNNLFNVYANNYSKNDVYIFTVPNKILIVVGYQQILNTSIGWSFAPYALDVNDAILQIDTITDKYIGLEHIFESNSTTIVFNFTRVYDGSVNTTVYFDTIPTFSFQFYVLNFDGTIEYDTLNLTGALYVSMSMVNTINLIVCMILLYTTI